MNIEKTILLLVVILFFAAGSVQAIARGQSRGGHSHSGSSHSGSSHSGSSHSGSSHSGSSHSGSSHSGSSHSHGSAGAALSRSYGSGISRYGYSPMPAYSNSYKSSCARNPELPECLKDREQVYPQHSNAAPG